MVFRCRAFNDEQRNSLLGSTARCSVSLTHGDHEFDVSIAARAVSVLIEEELPHSMADHPRLTELNAGAGCGHPRCRAPTLNLDTVQATNQANFDFSQNDRNGIAGIGVPSGYVSEGKSFYLRVPTGGVIVRRETSDASVPNTQVFP